MMKNPQNFSQRTPGFRIRRVFLQNCHLRRTLGAAASAVALGILSASSASAEVIAGLDNFDNGTNPTVPVTATGITASVVTEGEGRNWIAADGRGASSDGTWGTSAGPPSADTTGGTSSTPNLNLELSNAATGGTITLSVINDSGADIDLDAFHFDAYAFRGKAARTYELSVLAGGAVTEGIIYSSDPDEILVGNANNSNNVDQNFDHDLTVLADSTLEAGGTVEFLLQFSGGAGDGSGGHDLWVDNLAVTSSSADSDRLAITMSPASATAGEDFSITVEAQDGSGSPLAGGVTQDTQILLTASGSGMLSGNTITILAGENAVTLPEVQYTVAEDITLVASQLSGDLLAPSTESSTIMINAGPASVLSVEFSSDPELNDPVGNVSFRIKDTFDTLEVFAVSRDSVGNFIAYETEASFTLVNITGALMTSDLNDNMDGSATFTAQALGTATIRASVTGLPDGDSGLVTVEEPQFRWTGGNGGWGAGANWLDGTPVDFGATADLFFYDEYTTPTQIVLGGDRTVRSLNFTQFVDPVGTQGLGLGIRYTQTGADGPVDLTIDTDSVDEPAEINVAAGAEANIDLGFVNPPLRPDTDENYGDMFLADPLLITHLGTGNLLFSRPIKEIGGPMGVTIDATSTGTVIFGGANRFTGPTTVNGGVLRIDDGNSISDNATLVINGGKVDVVADERVVGLTLGEVAQPDGIYGSSESAAPVPDDVNFSGPGTITVGPAPPPAAGIVINDIFFSGEEEITITFTSEDNVDIYVSDVDDGFDWFLDLVDQPSGTYTYPFASTNKAFFILVTTGEPGPDSN